MNAFIATIDTALSGAVTDMTGFWGTVYDLKVAIVIALIGVGLLAKLRR